MVSILAIVQVERHGPRNVRHYCYHGRKPLDRQACFRGKDALPASADQADHALDVWGHHAVCRPAPAPDYIDFEDQFEYNPDGMILH